MNKFIQSQKQILFQNLEFSMSLNALIGQWITSDFNFDSLKRLGDRNYISRLQEILVEMAEERGKLLDLIDRAEKAGTSMEAKARAEESEKFLNMVPDELDRLINELHKK